MTQTNQPLTERRAWKALGNHFSKARTLHLRDLFAADPKRGERMTAEAVGLYLDYSENRAVLHVALRAPKGAIITVDGENVVSKVHAVLDKMADLSERVRSGAWK